MNAASLRAFGERAAIVGEALWPATVRVLGVDYACAAVKQKVRGVLEAGYESETVEQVVRVRKTILATEPVRDSFVIYGAKSWQVREVGGKGDADAEWVLLLERTK
jgi:hypothetical protein